MPYGPDVVMADEEHGTTYGKAQKCRKVRKRQGLTGACDRCNAVHAARMRGYRAKDPSLAARDRVRTAARQRAFKRLAQLHPAQFAGLFQEELEKEDA